MSINYSFLEYKEDFVIKKGFYGYHLAGITGGDYKDDSYFEIDTPWSAPNGLNSPILSSKRYDKVLAGYSLGGIESFDIYNPHEKLEYNQDKRRINKLVEGIL